MLDKLRGSHSARTKALKLPPSVGERHIGLRHYLGDGVFLCENGDLGACFKLPGIADEILTETELTEAFNPVTKFIQAVIKGVPSYKEDASTVIQLICSQRITDEIPEHPSDLPKNDAGAIIRTEEEHSFRNGLCVRQFFLAVRWQTSTLSSLKNTLNRLKAVLKNQKPNIYSELQKAKSLFIRELSNKLIESGLKAELLDSRALITYYNSVLAHGDGQVFDLEDDETSFFWDKIISSELKGSPKGFDSDNSNTRAFTFIELPHHFALGRMRLFMDNLPCRTFELAWTLSHGSKATGADFLLKKMFFSQGPNYQKKYEDILSFENAIDTTNPMLRMSVRLIAHDVDEEREGLILSAGVDYLAAPTICENQIAPHLITTSLPLNCSKEDHEIIGRFKTVLLDRAIMFAPFYTAPTQKNAVRNWVARSGEPIKVDVFGTGGNNHMVILGNSESGKSCLLSQFNVEFLWRFPDGVIRIVDRRTSYRKICDLFGGKIIQFNEAYLREQPYSPFAYREWDEDDIQNIVVFLCNAILQLNPEAVITGLHTEILGESIKLVANDQARNVVHNKVTGQAVDPHPTWVDIAKKLPTASSNKGSTQDLVQDALDDLRRWTVSFNATGQFGFLFCAQENMDLATNDAKIVVYDLEGISDPRLQVMASQLAFLKISRDLKKVSRDVRKLIIFEELGVMVSGDTPQAGEIATRFIRNVVKTARKIGAQCIGVSNELDDFTETAGGKTFFKVSPQRLFLPQSSATKAEIEHKLGKELSRADIDIIRSLHIKKGFYSQAYLIAENSSFKGSFLIPLSPIMNAIVTTTAPEEALYQRLRSQGHGVCEALEFMAKKHPYGRNL